MSCIFWKHISQINFQKFNIKPTLRVTSSSGDEVEPTNIRFSSAQWPFPLCINNPAYSLFTCPLHHSHAIVITSTLHISAFVPHTTDRRTPADLAPAHPHVGVRPCSWWPGHRHLAAVQAQEESHSRLTARHLRRRWRCHSVTSGSAWWPPV